MPTDNNGLDISHSRRTFIKSTAGAAGIGLVAGCMGGNQSNEEEQNGAGPDPNDETEDQELGFPERAIEFIIPFGPGGGYDAYTRLMARYLPKHLPHEVDVRVQNVEGAGGIIGTEQIYNADPDGYTNGIINVGKLGRDQIINDVRFDIRKISYYATVALEIPLVTVGKHTEIDSWEEYVQRIQAGELLFGTTGPASTTAANAYLPGEVSGSFSIEDVLDSMVVYDGTAEMVQGILREDIDVIAVAYSSALVYVQGGSVEPLIYLSMDSKPPNEVPEAATLATAGVNNGQQIADMVPARRAFGGPPEIPPGRVEILRNAMAGLLTEDEEMLAATKEAGRPITYQDGKETTEAIERYVNEWKNRQDLLDKIQGSG